MLAVLICYKLFHYFTLSKMSLKQLVLEIQFWCVKFCLTTVTVGYAKISKISIPSYQAMRAIE